VWATKKDPTLVGLRFLVIRPFTSDGKESAETLVAVDPLGAGIGERVLVVFGRAARHCIGRSHDIGFQTAVSAIIDKMELDDGSIIGPTASEDHIAAGSPRAASSAHAASGPSARGASDKHSASSAPARASASVSSTEAKGQRS